MDPCPFFDARTFLSRDSPPRKHTISAGGQLFLGLNVYNPHDGQTPHTHDGQDKAYVVLEGRGDFTVGTTTRRCGVGSTVTAGAGELHGVTNPGPDRLVLLVVMAPPPAGKA